MTEARWRFASELFTTQCRTRPCLFVFNTKHIFQMKEVRVMKTVKFSVWYVISVFIMLCGLWRGRKRRWGGITVNIVGNGNRCRLYDGRAD